jgi:hypothetical protein
VVTTARGVDRRRAAELAQAQHLSRGHSGLATAAGFLGAFLLAIVLLYLPFLQLRLATHNRLAAGFELREVRQDFVRAPWAFAFAFLITLLFALPFYVLKIEIVTREAAWLPSLVFIVVIVPARLLTGSALRRAARQTAPRHWFFRWTGRLPLLPWRPFMSSSSTSRSSPVGTGSGAFTSSTLSWCRCRSSACEGQGPRPYTS